MLPFSHLNLRYNPFGTLERIQLASIAEVELEDFIQQSMHDKSVVNTLHSEIHTMQVKLQKQQDQI